MQSNSPALPSNGHANLKWLWLLAPAIAILAALRNFVALQFLSALLLFAAAFLILAALVAGFLLFLDGVDHFYLWSLLRLASRIRPSGRAPQHAEFSRLAPQNSFSGRRLARAWVSWFFQPIRPMSRWKRTRR
ncbi:MAG TPA: hypothetical protein VMJ93_03840 [Verrucomicrobiae bacterium]|nr:hypothetical protein [Verrucomicrobiae bacterium]